MSNTSKLDTFQAILFILIVMVNKIILNFPKKIVLATNSGSIINLAYIGFMIIIFCIILSKLFSKFPGMDIIDISKYLGGNILKTLIGSLFIIFFAIAIILVTNNFSLMLKTIYFKTSPIIYIYLFFLIASILANRLGFKSIVKTNTIIIPFTVISIVFIIIGTFHDFKFENIYPVLGDNIKTTFLSGATNIFAFSGISYLYLIQPLLKNQANYNKVAITSMSVSWIFLFLSVLSLLLLFPFGAYNTNQNSLYIITRLVEFGDFIQRTDAIFILIWILATLSYLSIEVFFMVYITKKIVQSSNEKLLVYMYSAILLGLCMLFANESNLAFLDDCIFKYGTIIVNFGICLLILILACIKKRLKGDST